MPPIETRLTGPIGRIDPVSLNGRAVRLASGSADQPARADGADAPGSSPVVLGDTLNAGPPPIDAERVARIRKALEDGTYPIIPMTVADAIIADGLILRTAKCARQSSFVTTCGKWLPSCRPNGRHLPGWTWKGSLAARPTRARCAAGWPTWMPRKSTPNAADCSMPRAA
jgi:negative regulator of flagellin synthesis FlgM